MNKITIIEIKSNFDLNKIKSDNKFMDFDKENSDLSNQLNIVLDKLNLWIHTNPYDLSNDFYYDSTFKTPLFYTGDWGVDDNNDGAPTWEDARKQMGTTRNKFSINEALNEKNCDVAKKIGLLFKDLGFIAFEATYSSWRLGYDYSLYDLDVMNTLGRSEYDYKHICLALNNKIVISQ